MKMGSELIQVLLLLVSAGLAVAVGYKLLQCLCWGVWCIFVHCHDAYRLRTSTVLIAFILLLPITLVVSLLIGLFVVFHLPAGLRNSWPSRQEE